MDLAATFLRRWSTIDITPDNALLFEEHKAGVLAIMAPQERRVLDGLHAATPRATFAERYQRTR